MAYHNDLLQQALQLVNNEVRKPKQASLRRAVSTAYYALFHLLVSEAVANWRQANLRGELGRAFDHATMKTASNRLQDARQFPFKGESPAVVVALRSVSRTFALLQEERHVADYDNTRFWTKKEALVLVNLAQRAFNEWSPIRDERIAQNYLLSLLVKKRS